MIRGLVITLLLAHAADAGPLDDRRMSLTLSPFHAPLPALELTGEVRITRSVSAAVIGGIGTFLDARGHPHGAREIGGQGVYYLKPTFRELHIGVEVTYVKADDVVSATTFTGTAVAVGAFVGWKYIHRTGVTLLAQGGLAMGWVETIRRDTDTRVLPLINLQVGWSF